MAISVRRLSRAAAITPRVLTHPAVMYNTTQLNVMAADITASGSNSRKTNYNTLLTRTAASGANSGTAFSSLSWTPAPVPVVKRYQSGSYTDVGDADLIADGIAALTHAFVWRLTGNRASASKSSAILNAWSSTITGIANGYPESSTVAADGKLLAGWTASTLARAGEIMAHSDWTAGGGETAFNAAQFKNRLQTIWQPILTPTEPIGQHNWFGAVIDGAMQTAVFLDDHEAFDNACAWWRDVVPTVFWMPGDTNSQPQLAASTPPSSGLPRVPAGSRYNVPTSTRSQLLSYWQNPLSWPAGLSGELGRDFHHNAMIFATVANAAETAWHQGVDLYGEEQTRIVTATELFAGFLNEIYVNGNTSPAGWPFAKSATSGSYTTSTQRATFELLYMHYHDRKGVAMPNTASLLVNYTRPSTFDIDTGPGMVFCEEMTFRGNAG